jgi:CheY-like chemotaxis protein
MGDTFDMRKIRILIVDNDEDEQFFIEKGFMASGLFEITGMVFNGTDLFKILHDENVKMPEVILSDLHMNGMSGYDIVEEIRNNPKFSSIPVIISSNVISSSLIEKCKGLGAFDLKKKPENFNDYDTFAKKLYSEIVDTIHQTSNGGNK